MVATRKSGPLPRIGKQPVPKRKQIKPVNALDEIKQEDDILVLEGNHFHYFSRIKHDGVKEYPSYLHTVPIGRGSYLTIREPETDRFLALTPKDLQQKKVYKFSRN